MGPPTPETSSKLRCDELLPHSHPQNVEAKLNDSKHDGPIIICDGDVGVLDLLGTSSSQREGK